MMLTECRRVHFSGMIAVCAVSLTANTQMTTSQYDNARTGTYLTVNSQQFGKIFTMKVDGDVYAQPLFLAGVEVPRKGGHDLVSIATEHDSVYALRTLWQSCRPAVAGRFPGQQGINSFSNGSRTEQ
jgi:hypothetical protein